MPDLSETLGIATYRKSESRIVIRLNGPLDNANASRLMDELAEADPYVRDLVELDLEDVTSIDSTGIGALIYAEAFVRLAARVSRSPTRTAASSPRSSWQDSITLSAPAIPLPATTVRDVLTSTHAARSRKVSRDRRQAHTRRRRPSRRRLDISCHQNAHGINLDVAGEIDSYSASILTARWNERSPTPTDGSSSISRP